MSKDPVNFMFQEQMGAVLFNPTDEPFDLQYAGMSFSVKPNEKLTVSVQCANHVLNAYGQRGLCHLVYGSDEKVIAEAGKERNLQFRHRMVQDFNQRNENRKVQGMGYLVPTTILKKYAKELGMELMEPYAARDEERAKLQSQEGDIAFLRNSLAEMMKKLDALSAPPAESETEDTGKEKSGLRVRKDGKWVKE